MPDFMLESILQDLELEIEVSLMLSEEPIFLEKFLEVYLGIKSRNIFKHIVSMFGKNTFLSLPPCISRTINSYVTRYITGKIMTFLLINTENMFYGCSQLARCNVVYFRYLRSFHYIHCFE